MGILIHSFDGLIFSFLIYIVYYLHSIMAKAFKVYFLDNSYKSILVDPKQTTIEELWEIVCEKIEILPLNRRCFFIWGFGESLRLLLYSDDTIETVLKDWPDYE